MYEVVRKALLKQCMASSEGVSASRDNAMSLIWGESYLLASLKLHLSTRDYLFCLVRTMIAFILNLS